LLQYNDGVRAIDLSGNFIEDSDLLTYINSSKHVIGKELHRTTTAAAATTTTTTTTGN
jgi:hypothetical protein